MARKDRRKEFKKDRDRRNRAKRRAESPFPLVDHRAMERVLRDITGKLTGGRRKTPLDEAQEVMYDAFDSEDVSKKIDLAMQALEISPDCTDAYVLLAEHAGTAKDATEFYQQGVAAAERALGKEFFQEHAGHFWGILETRPYMRARMGLAQCLWALGRHEEAVGHYQDMLRLNPNDNQGVRDLLAACLLDLERDSDLARLVAQYEADATTCWAYTKAILAFRQEGDSSRARGLLEKARKGNKFVPDYLLGHKQLPKELAEFVTFGGEDEAISYVAGHLSGWKTTPGAISWLRSVLKIPLPETPAPRKPSFEKVKWSLSELLQVEGEVWQADIARFPSTVVAEGEEFRPWVILITNRTDDEPLVIDILEERPTSETLWEALVQCMVRPSSGEPHRPERVEVRQKGIWHDWHQRLAEVEIECVVCEDFGLIEHVLERTAELMATREETQAEPGGDTDLAELPQAAEEEWQADIRRVPTWIEQEGTLKRPWVVLVTNRTHDLILLSEVRMEEPDSEWLWQYVCKAMQQPVIGEPHRPAQVQVSTVAHHELLRPRLGAIGVDCVVREKLDQLDAAFDDMESRFADKDAVPALVDMPGVQPEQVGSFFDAAASFYRQRPWRMVPGDTIIRVDCPARESGTWYAVVMGQSGMALGVALYEDLKHLRALIEGRISEKEHMRHTSALSLQYGEAFEMSVRDVDAAERFDWPVAGPEAYPWVVRLNPGQAIRPPLGWELELLEACLRAIPEFLSKKGVSAEQFTPLVASGQLALKLSWLK